HIHKLILLIIVLLANNLNAQETDPFAKEKSGLWFGLNIGYYFANKYNAGFYNGDPGNENNINYIFSNKYHYNEIYQAVNAADTFFLVDYPSGMKYDPVMNVGFVLSLRNSRNMSFFIQINYAKLQTKDVYSVEVDPATYLTFSDLRLYSIYGTEERTLIDLGMCRHYKLGENIEAAVEGGLNLSSTNVISSKIKIEELEYSLVNVYLNQYYVPNTQLTEYNIKQGGIGYGLFLGGSIKFFFTESLSLDPGFYVYFKQINLAGYQKFTFHYNFFLRFTFKDIFKQNH
ncbi:hypothetical protein ACFLRZ_00945, partial [Bacteroidota bacterium]